MAKTGAIRQDRPHSHPAANAPDLDRLIHERVRLGIVSALAASESLTFNELKKLLHSTDGNIGVHTRKLEEARYIVCTKSFDGRIPKTEYRPDPGRPAGAGTLPQSYAGIDRRDASSVDRRFFWLSTL